MSLEHLALGRTDNFPLKHEGNVHNGKVRSVYWLPSEDSKRLIHEREYTIPSSADLGVMIISDRISAFDCNWQGTYGLQGVPGKGAALNAISQYWFQQFQQQEIGNHHIVEVPHPLVWIVRKAEPIKVEGVARQYITGSLWRAYEQGTEQCAELFPGVTLPQGLQKNQCLVSLLLTPTTKGVLEGIPGVPAEEDTNVTREQLLTHYQAFGFKKPEDVGLYERLVTKGFDHISQKINDADQIFVDTKFEFGYVSNGEGHEQMIYIDEVGTPDSSRMWSLLAYQSAGDIVEHSKEGFRQFLLQTLDEKVLLDKKQMKKREALAREYRVPVDAMMEVSRTYTDLAERITGKPLPQIAHPREEILDALNTYGLIQ